MASRELPHGTEPVVLRGSTATALLAKTLVQVNRRGARQRELNRALDHIAADGGAQPFLRRMAARSNSLAVPGLEQDHPFGELLAFRAPPLRARDIRTDPIPPVWGKDWTEALALEMALHEETERRALHGELAMLEAMWRDAEEIAAIADALPDLPALEPPRLTAGG